MVTWDPAVLFFYNSLFPAKSWQDPASIDGEEQNKKLPPQGIELTTSRSSVQCSTDCARQESVEKEISEVNFVSCITSDFGLGSIQESIEHDFIKA